MLGQNHHFNRYAPEKIPYAIERYVNETHRLYGVLNRRLDGRRFIAGTEYTIADMAAYPWIVPWKRQQQDMPTFLTFVAGSTPFVHDPPRCWPTRRANPIPAGRRSLRKARRYCSDRRRKQPRRGDAAR